MESMQGLGYCSCGLKMIPLQQEVREQERKKSLVISVKSEVAPVSVTHRHGQRAGAIYASENTQGGHGTLCLQLAILGQTWSALSLVVRLSKAWISLHIIWCHSGSEKRTNKKNTSTGLRSVRALADRLCIRGDNDCKCLIIGVMMTDSRGDHDCRHLILGVMMNSCPILGVILTADISF